jgi:hypothetical protein
MVLNSYRLSYSGTVISLVTATGFDYGLQHSAKARSMSEYNCSWLGHRVASLMLWTPGIGLISAIFLNLLSALLYNSCCGYNSKSQESNPPATPVTLNVAAVMIHPPKPSRPADAASNPPDSINTPASVSTDRSALGSPSNPKPTSGFDPSELPLGQLATSSTHPSANSASPEFSSIDLPNSKEQAAATKPSLSLLSNSSSADTAPKPLFNSAATIVSEKPIPVSTSEPISSSSPEQTLKIQYEELVPEPLTMLQGVLFTPEASPPIARPQIPVGPAPQAAPAISSTGAIASAPTPTTGFDPSEIPLEKLVVSATHPSANSTVRESILSDAKEQATVSATAKPALSLPLRPRLSSRIQAPLCVSSKPVLSLLPIKSRAKTESSVKHENSVKLASIEELDDEGPKEDEVPNSMVRSIDSLTETLYSEAAAASQIGHEKESAEKQDPFSFFAIFDSLAPYIPQFPTISAAMPSLPTMSGVLPAATSALTSAAMTAHHAVINMMIKKPDEASGVKHVEADRKVNNQTKVAEDNFDAQIAAIDKSLKNREFTAAILEIKIKLSKHQRFLIDKIRLVQNAIVIKVSKEELLRMIINLRSDFVNSYDCLVQFAQLVNDQKKYLGIDSYVVTPIEHELQAFKAFYTKLSQQIEEIRTKELDPESIEANYLVSPAIRYIQAPKSWAAYVRSCCEGTSLEQSHAMQEEGAKLLKGIFAGTETTPTPEKMKSIIWRLMFKSVETGDGYEEGSFIIDDPDSYFYKYLLACRGVYDRLSSHPVGGQSAGAQGILMNMMNMLTNAAQQRGLDVEGLPAKKRTILFDQLITGRFQNSKALFLKIENHGTNKFVDSWQHLKEYIQALKNKKIKGADDLPNMRKERVPNRERDLFVSITKVVKAKESLLKESLLVFLSQTVLGDSNQKLHADVGLNQCYAWLVHHSGPDAKKASLSDMQVYLEQIKWLIDYRDPKTNRALISIFDELFVKKVNLLLELLSHFDNLEDRFGSEKKFRVKDLIA